MSELFKQIDENYIKFENKIIRIMIDINDYIWFNGNDTADALGYKNPKDTIKNMIGHDEKKNMKNIDSLKKIGSQPNSVYLSESGLYNLIIQSRLLKAQKFRKWVTGDVLPSIRKYGSYKLKKKYEIELNDVLCDLKFLKKENEILKNDLKKECYPNGGIVYVIDYSDDENDIYRIGMTNCMNKRKSLYDTHSLHKKKVVHMIESVCPLRLESCVRSMLYEKRYKNNKDYFICSLQTIKRAFTTCLKSIECMNQEGGSNNNFSDKKILSLKNKSNTLKAKLKIIKKHFN
jgi:prophage antirepressor-like protein